MEERPDYHSGVCETDIRLLRVLPSGKYAGYISDRPPEHGYFLLKRRREFETPEEESMGQRLVYFDYVITSTKGTNRAFVLPPNPGDLMTVFDVPQGNTGEEDEWVPSEPRFVFRVLDLRHGVFKSSRKNAPLTANDHVGFCMGEVVENEDFAW